MTEAAWQASVGIISALSACISAVAVALISKTRSEATKASEAASAARKNTENTGNGFAEKVTGGIAGLRREVRNNEVRLEWLIEAVTTHLAEHQSGRTCPAGFMIAQHRPMESHVEPFDPSVLE